jgi:aminopeptidase N
VSANQTPASECRGHAGAAVPGVQDSRCGQGERAVPDPYFPRHGDPRYQVLGYELDLDYKPAVNRLAATARLSAVAAAEAPLAEFALDFAGLRVGRVLVNSAPARFTVEVRYSGAPRPVDSFWGALGWEELADGALVASQPTGAPSWYPCNDHPADKAAYRISVTVPSAYTVVANGSLRSRVVRASTTTWVYEQPAPTATYLVTVQIGRYKTVRLAEAPVAQTAAIPARLRRRFASDFARQPQMMALFEDLFGPYPFAEYAVVLADDQLDVPVEAQGLSIFGANHVDGKRGSERLVAHELAHQWFGNSLTVAGWRHIWLNEGFAKYAEWLWSEHSDGPSAAAMAAESHAQLSLRPQTLCLADPGVRKMFDDRLYRRGALVLHAVRCAIGDRAFFALLRDWTAEQRHGTVTTEQFTRHARRYAAEPLDALFQAWLHDTALPRLPAERGR